jgi:HEAT repeat protein
MELQEIRSAFQSEDDEIRRAALYSLRLFTCFDAQSLFFTAMGDASWRIRKDAVECYLSTQPDEVSVGALLRLIRNEDNAGLRNSAAEAVIRLGTVCATPLKALLHDGDADVRKFIVDIMGAIGDPLFVPTLIEALGDPEVNVAAAAAEQLGILGDVYAAEFLMQAILQRDEVLFRFSALGALGLLAPPTVVPDSLVALADQDILKKTVYDCLGAIADASSIAPLLEGLSCRQKSSRAAAVMALHKIYGRSTALSQESIRDALRGAAEDATISGLLELFDNQDSALTHALLWTGVVLRDARYIPLLVDAYTDERTAFAAFSALKCFDREAVQEIIARYSRLDENGRSGLCLMIAEGGYAGFADVIQESLHDSSAQVRKAAAVAAGTLGLATLVPDLVALIDDTEAAVYAAVIASLQSLIGQARTTISAVAGQFCLSQEPHRRTAAALLLAALGEMDRLLPLLADEDSHVRIAAVTAVAGSPGKTAAALLVSVLLDEDPDVRIAAADALGSVGDATAVEALEQAMNDDDIWVQSAVLKAVACIDPDRSKAMIARIQFRAEGLLMITCLKILEELGGVDPENIIRNAVHNSDPDIVRQASISLERITAVSRA